MKHRYCIYGVNNKGEFVRGTCLDYEKSENLQNTIEYDPFITYQMYYR